MLISASLLMLVPALTGYWVLVSPQGEENRMIRFGKAGRFEILTPSQSKPSPVTFGTFAVTGQKHNISIVRFLVKGVRQPPYAPHRPYGGDPLTFDFRYVPKIPALIVNRKEAYVPCRDVGSVERRLAAWRKTIQAQG